MLDEPLPKWGCYLGSFGSNGGHPVALRGRGAAGAALHMVQPRAFRRATELAASSLELLLHRHTLQLGRPRGTSGASSSGSFVFHSGHGPVFRVEVVSHGPSQLRLWGQQHQFSGSNSLSPDQRKSCSWVLPPLTNIQYLPTGLLGAEVCARPGCFPSVAHFRC